jgi:hypothetical protein
MSKSNQLLEKVNTFDKLGIVKHEVDEALVAQKELRHKFPFNENLRSIEWLDPDKLFKVNPDEVGEFFQLLEQSLKPVNYSNIPSSSNVYRNTRLQISEFKNLLRTAVDDRKSLGEKVDAQWDRIGGVGQDKVLAKKIIYCFNSEKGTVLPVFSSQHLRHFSSRVADASSEQAKYYSAGQEYEHYTQELLKTKHSLPITKNWTPLYFARFLYATYTPPDSEPIGINASAEGKVGTVVTNEQLDLQGFVKLLGELQKMGKITGEQFRENRSLWMRQAPNDRDLTVWRLKQILNTEAKTNPNTSRNQSDEPPKRPARQRL